MKELRILFRHCFETAEKISEKNGMLLSKGLMDIPGPRDSEGRAPFAEYPILESSDKSIRIVFTYETDTSSDIEGKKRTIIDQEFKTPFLRLSLLLKDHNSVFFRIYKQERSFFNNIKNMLNIVPGTKLNISENSGFLYYLNCPDQENDLIEKIYVSELIQKLENFKNLTMLRVDSRDVTLDFKCDRTELYTAELIEYYLSTIRQVLAEILKM